MDDKPSLKGTAERTAAVSFTELNARRLGPVRRFFRAHPRAMDAVVVVVFLLAAVPNSVFEVLSANDWRGVPRVVLLSVALAFRRDRPLVVLAVVAVVDAPLSVLTGVTGSIGIATMFSLYTVAAAKPLRTALIASGAAGVVAVSSVFLIPPDTVEDVVGVSWLFAGFLTTFMAAAVGIGVTVRRDREHESEVREWAARNAELASAGERNRIAREMHDVIAHSLTVMVALSDGAGVVMKRDPARAASVLDELSRTGRTAIADMRRVLGVLRAEAASESRVPLPASSSLAQLLEGFRAAGLPLRVTTSGPHLPEDPAFQLTVYRILQESLTNVLRYGKGVSLVDVSIARSGDAVSLRVTDDGGGSMGPPVSLGSGRGIAGMQERAAIYAGTVHCGARPSGGWVVDVQLTAPGPAADTTAGTTADTTADTTAGTTASTDHHRGNGNDSGAARTGHTDQGSPRGRPAAVEDGVPADPRG